MTLARSLSALFVVGFLAALGGCAIAPLTTTSAKYTAVPANAVLKSVPMDPALEDRILALKPEKITAADVRDTLSKAPAPRIFTIRGGIYPVYLAMESFGAFLIGMGYPEERIVTPHERDWSLSPYQSSDEVAGLIAWCYEREGVRPTILGHSQGASGRQVLHVGAGDWASELHPYNPLTSQFEGGHDA
jgi:hypothetical protein